MSEPLVVPGEVDAQTGAVHLDIPAAQHRAACRARFGGQRVDVEVRKRKSKRSGEQNRWMHPALAEWIRDTLPEYRPPAMSLKDGVERLKDELLALTFGYHVYQSRLTGEIVKVLAKPHTSALSTSECCEVMDVAMEEAAKTGHVIEEPDEWKARRAKAKRSA